MGKFASLTRSSLALLVFTAGILFCNATALANAPSSVPNSLSEPRLLSFPFGMSRSFDLSPDGVLMAYVTLELTSTTSGKALMWVKSVDGGEAVRLPGKIDGASITITSQYARPVWSPDGRFLAYFAMRGGRLHLHVWDRKKETTSIFDDVPACRRYCNWYEPQWSPDSRKFYFLAEHQGEAAAGRYDPVDDVATFMKYRRQLLLSDPENDGVTVSSFPKAAPALDGAQQGSGNINPYVDVAMADVTRGNAKRLFSGAASRQIRLSPDGKKLLIAAILERNEKVTQRLHDFYALDVSRKPGRYRFQADIYDAVDSYGKEVKPIAAGVRIWGARFAWSPDSRKIAYAEQGPLSEGDVFLLDATTGATSNISKDVIIPDLDTSPDRRQPSGGKFGDPFRSLVWSKDGSYVFALHGGNDYDYMFQPDKARLFQIWRLPVNGGQPKRLTAGSDYEVYHIFNDRGFASPGASENSLLAAGRAKEGENVIVDVNIDSGEVSTLVEFSGKAFSLPSVVSRAAHHGRVAFVNETNETPSELFMYDANRSEIFPVTSINAAYQSEVAHTRHIIDWKTDLGEASSGVLYLPNTASEDQPAPLLIQVYAGHLYADTAENRYKGRTDSLLYPAADLLRQGYAVFEVGIPIVGGGESCDGVARHAEAALSAVGAQTPVDADRAVAYGFSFGGWSVQCIVTRTDAYRAGISGAGISNNLSYRFSYALARGLVANGGQTAINKSVWEAPMAFWSESPIGRAIDVDTPLLLLHGKEDWTVPYEQSVEMYIALSDLGKTVTLVGFDGKDHYSVVDHPDYKKRIVEWVERYIGRPGEPFQN